MRPSFKGSFAGVAMALASFAAPAQAGMRIGGGGFHGGGFHGAGGFHGGGFGHGYRGYAGDYGHRYGGYAGGYGGWGGHSAYGGCASSLWIEPGVLTTSGLPDFVRRRRGSSTRDML